ncbi:MAG: serine hydrolase domain-containing protein, partial [Bacteroidales bacterium]
MKRISVLLFAVLCSAALLAQTASIRQSPPLAEVGPEVVGLSPERIARIDRMCAQAVKDGQVPGAVALIARDGKIALWKAYGMADTEAARPLRRDDLFRIASQTKAITATAVMMLWEEGRFQLDDPISKWIPAFAEAKVLTGFNYADTSWTGEPVKSPVTIRQLLSHTSGIGYGMIDPDERFRLIYEKAGIVDAFTAEAVTLDTNIPKLATMPLHFHPGTQYNYSEGLDVLGYFIELVSGMPFDQFLKTRIFDPLGMTDTRFYFPTSAASRLVKVQYPVDGQWKNFTTPGFEVNYPVTGARTYFAGGAGLTSTIKDYAVFLQMYLNGGEYNGIRLLSRTTVDVILSNQIGDIWGEEPDAHFSLAFQVITPEGQAKGGQGSAGTFSWGGYWNT